MSGGEHGKTWGLITSEGILAWERRCPRPQACVLGTRCSDRHQVNGTTSGEGFVSVDLNSVVVFIFSGPEFFLMPLPFMVGWV